jgi:hypothetical protein
MLHIPQAPRSTAQLSMSETLAYTPEAEACCKEKKHFYFYFGHSRGHVLEIVTTKMKKEEKIAP